MKIYLILLLISIYIAFITATEIIGDDESDEIADVSNLTVHIVGGVIFFTGVCVLLGLIHVYNRIKFNEIPPQMIVASLTQSSFQDHAFGASKPKKTIKLQNR